MKQKSLKKNFIISLVRTIIMLVVPLVIFPYASRVLGKEGVGRVQYIQSIASYFQLFAISGIASYGIREGTRLRDDREKLGKFVTEMLLINFGFTAIATIVYLILFSVPALEAYHSIMFIFIFFVFFNGMALDWYFNIVEEFAYITVRSFILYFIAVLILFLTMRDYRDAEAYAVVIVFPYIGTFLLNFLYIYRRLPLFAFWRTKCLTNEIGKEKYEIRKHIKPILFVFSIILSANVFYLIDTTMFGIMIGDAAVGSYTAASKMTRLLIQMLAAVCAVFLPRLSYYVGTGQSERFKSLAADSANVILWIAIPCSVGLIALAPEAIMLFSGKEFLDAVSSLRILAVNLIFSALNSFVGWHVLVPHRKEYILLLATSAGVVLDFVLNVLFIRKIGLPGAAIATLFSEILVFVICLWFSKSYLEWKRVFRHACCCLAASVPVGGISLAGEIIGMNILGKCFFTVAVSALVYVVCLLACKDELMRKVFASISRIIDKKAEGK